jgi:3-deoxy-D-manno-octulosonic-acid transferase
MRHVRDAAYLAAAAATAPLWAWRMHRTGKLRTDWAGRFGRGDALPAPVRPRILVHAVSVGEVNAVRMLVDRLASDPLAPEVVVSATTDTGSRRAREVFGPRHAVVRYPFDASWMVDRFLNRVQPDMVALCELEVWPNFVGSCVRRGIPVAVVNGRLSERSFGRYRAARGILGGSFRALAAALVQDHDYAERFEAMGVPHGRVFVTGTMKWDTAQVADSVPGSDALASELGIDRSRPVVVAGSTAPEEHALLRESLPPGAQLICAPRKPEWFDAAAQAIDAGVRRSRPGLGRPNGRFLLDTIGELRKAYALADVAVVGRSFGALHGSDPMEPAALGKPVVCGPRMGDFRESAAALADAGGVLQVDAGALAQTLARLIEHPAERAERGRAGQECVRAHQGATERTAEALLSMLAGIRRA